MRGLEIARENRMPYVQFVESAGADLRGDGGGDPEAAMKRDSGATCALAVRYIRAYAPAYSRMARRMSIP